MARSLPSSWSQYDGHRTKLWSSQSIKVMASSILHRAQLSDLYMKNRLCWLSDLFLVYSCNTIYAANAHTKVLNINLGNLAIFAIIIVLTISEGVHPTVPSGYGDGLLMHCSLSTQVQVLTLSRWIYLARYVVSDFNIECLT